MEKISRETAVQLGLKRYFTGVPCSRGHISERYAKCSTCVACHRLAMEKYRERDPELTRLRNRLYKQRQKARDPERVRRQWREWFARQKAKEVRENSHSR
jgi:hypothetical protein